MEGGPGTTRCGPGQKEFLGVVLFQTLEFLALFYRAGFSGTAEERKGECLPRKQGGSSRPLLSTHTGGMSTAQDERQARGSPFSTSASSSLAWEGGTISVFTDRNTFPRWKCEHSLHRQHPSSQTLSRKNWSPGSTRLEDKYSEGSTAQPEEGFKKPPAVPGLSLPSCT